MQNYDTMTTTGASSGKSPRVTNIGFNQDDRNKQEVTRNTVVENAEINKTPESPINRDVMKANEVTKDVHHSTNVNVESQTIEYATNPTKFKEDLEVAILEGKATGETVLKTIENLVNGGKEDIGDPERRSLNEIKEAVIRVKTAPEMNAIATGDLNSQEVLDTLKINGIEKFNPDDPDLPENIRARLDEVRKSGGEIEAFYDKTTNKIFINENVEDGETRALVAREWKISEDLKDGKGKANDEGQLKATIAGELAYDDMMKRAGEGKTGSISTGELNEAVMDINSEVTSDAQYTTKLKKYEINKKMTSTQIISNLRGFINEAKSQDAIPHAVQSLEYFLSCKGGTLDVDKNWYRSIEGVKKAEERNINRFFNVSKSDDFITALEKGYKGTPLTIIEKINEKYKGFEKMKIGETVEFNDYWETKVENLNLKKKEDQDFYLTFGATVLKTSAKVTAQKLTNDNISITITEVKYTLVDKYDWETTWNSRKNVKATPKQLEKYTGIKGVELNLQDSAMQKLVNEGKGKPFDYRLTYSGKDRTRIVNFRRDVINKYWKLGGAWRGKGF